MKERKLQKREWGTPWKKKKRKTLERRRKAKEKLEAIYRPSALCCSPWSWKCFKIAFAASGDCNFPYNIFGLFFFFSNSYLAFFPCLLSFALIFFIFLFAYTDKFAGFRFSLPSVPLSELVLVGILRCNFVWPLCLKAKENRMLRAQFGCRLSWHLKTKFVCVFWFVFASWIDWFERASGENEKWLTSEKGKK